MLDDKKKKALVLLQEVFSHFYKGEITWGNHYEAPLNISNIETIYKQWPEIVSLDFIDYYEEKCLNIDMDKAKDYITEDSNNDIHILQSLIDCLGAIVSTVTNYPVINDDHFYALEHQLFLDAWQEYYRDDLYTQITKIINNENATMSPDFDELLEDTDISYGSRSNDDLILNLLEKLASEYEVEVYICEDIGGAYVYEYSYEQILYHPHFLDFVQALKVNTGEGKRAIAQFLEGFREKLARWKRFESQYFTVKYIMPHFNTGSGYVFWPCRIDDLLSLELLRTASKMIREKTLTLSPKTNDDIRSIIYSFKHKKVLEYV